MDLLGDVRHVYSSANTLQKREFVNMVFDGNLYYQEGIYRTPTMLNIFSRNASKKEEKGYRIIQKKEGKPFGNPSKWSRGESNSRPNKQLKNFLHAYFLIGFSLSGLARNSHRALIFLVVKTAPKLDCF